MNENPIVEEVHRVREQMLAEFNGEFNSLVEYLRQRTEESAAADRRVVALPARLRGAG